MTQVSQWIYQVIGLAPETQIKILSTIIIILILWILRVVVLRIVWKKTEDAQLRYRWRKWLTYILVFLGFIFVGRVWFAGIESIATYLGLLSAGLAIALKDLVAGIAGWFFILWRKPFSTGDRIQIGNHRGDVVDIRLFKFSLMEIGNWVDAEQSTGRIMHIPNAYVLSEVIINYSQGFRFIWNEIPVLITFESDWEKAKAILQKIGEIHSAHLSAAAEKKLKEVSKRYMISYSNLTPIVYTSVRDSGVLLTIRYLIEPKMRRSSEQEIWEAILKEFAQCPDIDFAYPTQRFYNNSTEGKPGRRTELEF
jgi:small-conductance mechanosensitive channel